MNERVKQTKHLGRPRSKSAQEEIFQATITLLNKEKFSNVTVEGIAKASGVSKTTIYRRWKNKNELLLSIFINITDQQINFDEKISIDENFRKVVENLAIVLNQSVGRALLSVLLDSPELLAEFQTSFFEPKRFMAKHILMYGQQRHIIRQEINLDKALDMLFGAIYLRIFLNPKVIDENYIEEVITEFMREISMNYNQKEELI